MLECWLCISLVFLSCVRWVDMCGCVSVVMVDSLVMVSFFCFSSVSRCMWVVLVNIFSWID